MNFKFAPRHRLRGYVQRWTLHPDDFITMVLTDVDASAVDSSRGDLHYLDCGRMPRISLDNFETHLNNLWRALEWANDDAEKGAHFTNCFSLAGSVPAYNIYRLQLPTEGLCRLRITVQGVHCDTRFGNTYSPIIIIEEMMIGRAPTIHVGGKRMVLPEEPAADSCEDSEEEEEEVTPAAVHPRLRTKDCMRMWQKADEATRKSYYHCSRHGGFICPDCRVHVPNWETFSSLHYACSCFSALTKALICDISFN